MEKKSVCKSCSSTGKPYQSQYGTLYSWNVVFDNGDKGLCNTQKETAPFEIGKEYDYDIQENIPTKSGGTYNKIKKVSKKEFIKRNPTIVLKAFACKYATRFVTSGIIPAPTEGNNEEWSNLCKAIDKSAKSFLKEMMYDVDVYGAENTDVIGTAMSQAIDCVIEKKISKDRIYLYYRVLLEAVLVKPQPQA